MNQRLAEFLSAFFGYRKMILLLFLYIIGVTFRIHNLLNGAEMVDLLKSTTIAFIGVNGMSKIVTAVKEHAIAKTTAGAATDAPEEKETSLEIQG